MEITFRVFNKEVCLVEKVFALGITQILSISPQFALSSSVNTTKRSKRRAILSSCLVRHASTHLHQPLRLYCRRLNLEK